MSEPKLALLCLCVAMTLGCSEGPSYVREEGERDRGSRVANLKRAAALPWTDNGRCAVREASKEWPVLAERCYGALELERIRFHDVTGRCTVASADAAAVGVTGLCVLAAPEIVVGAVIVIGVVVVAVVIAEELEEYKRMRQVHPLAEDSARGPRPVAGTRLSPEREVSSEPGPVPQSAGSGSGGDVFPPIQTEPRQPQCEPLATPHLGGDALHNQCADAVPQNDFSGFDVLVNGKRFDALQLGGRVLWEVKTDNFDTYSTALRRIVLGNQVPELRRERDLAEACGFEFRVAVRSAAHQAELLRADRFLDVVVMDWC